MSHRATSWAVQQRGLKPAVKILLWHLSDRHNVDNGCFPNQAMLAHDCEMSRASINRHLDELEHVGLIRRVPRVNTATGQQLSTRYILAFEDGFEALDVVSRVSNCDTAPCLNNADNRVSNSAEPVSHSCETLTCKGTRKEPSSLRDDDARERFAEVWKIFPLRPGQSRKTALKAFLALSDRDQLACLAGARTFAAQFEAERQARAESPEKAKRYVVALVRWIENEGWADFAPPAAADDIVVVSPASADFNLLKALLGERLVLSKAGNATVRVEVLALARAAA